MSSNTTVRSVNAFIGLPVCSMNELQNSCSFCTKVLTEISKYLADPTQNSNQDKNIAWLTQTSDEYEASRRTCDICDWRYQRSEIKPGFKWFYSWVTIEADRRSISWAQIATEEEFDESNPGVQKVWDEFRLEPSDDSIEQPPQSDVAQTLRSWLSNCADKHELCIEEARLRVRESLPARLIDIGATEASTPKLCLTKDIPSDAIYTALSHRWGTDGVPLRLLHENFDTFLDKIPLDALSPTFMHAILATRSVGARYIWIDSLCIVQDSVQDWEEQAQLMTSIYEHAYCTIAFNRDHPLAPGLLADDSPDLSKTYFLRLPHSNQKYTILESDRAAFWRKYVSNGPLFTRGWCVQERFLSLRVIYFCTPGVFYECPCTRHANISPFELTDTFLDGSSGRSFNGTVAHDKWLRLASPPSSSSSSTVLSSPDHTPHASQIDWAHLLTSYTRGRLTFESHDKLIAISGIARTISNAGSYLAGLWSAQLPHNLLWMAMGQRHVDRGLSNRLPERIEGSRSSRMPSWSWGSLSGDVFPGAASRGRVDKERGYEARVVDVQVELAGKDLFGGVAGGFIEVEAFLLRIPPIVDTNLLSSEDPTNVTYVLERSSLGPATVLLQFDTLSDASIARQAGLWLLSLSCTVPFYTNPWSVEGLILQRTANTGEFQRRGRFSTTDAREESEGWSNMCLLWASAEFAVGCGEEDVLGRNGGTGEVRVRIV